MQYEKDNVILDFARRTRANLAFLDAARDRGENVFEVTQLANSLLGLLVFPKEHYIQSIPTTPLDDLVRSGWPDIHPTEGSLPQNDLRSLISMLRNSIAHFNVEFIADKSGEIIGVRMWNLQRGRRTWAAEPTIADLRAIALKFIELLEKDHAPENLRMF